MCRVIYYRLKVILIDDPGAKGLRRLPRILDISRTMLIWSRDIDVFELN